MKITPGRAWSSDLPPEDGDHQKPVNPSHCFEDDDPQHPGIGGGPEQRKPDQFFKGIFSPEGKVRRVVGKQWMIAVISVRVSHASKENCDGRYYYEAMHQGKPLFKTESGAIIYFSKHWKLNERYKTAGWVYSASPDAKGILPPEGKWTTSSSLPPSNVYPGMAPDVKLLEEPLERLSESGGQLHLEGKRTVQKKDENKAWRWVEVPIYEDALPRHEPPTAPSPQPSVAAGQNYSPSLQPSVPAGYMYSAEKYRWKQTEEEETKAQGLSFGRTKLLAPAPAAEPSAQQEESCRGCGKEMTCFIKTCAKCRFSFHAACVEDPDLHECVKEAREQSRSEAEDSSYVPSLQELLLNRFE